MREQTKMAEEASIRNEMDEMRRKKWTAGCPEDRGCRKRCKSGLMGRKKSSGVYNTTLSHTNLLATQLDQCVPMLTLCGYKST